MAASASVVRTAAIDEVLEVLSVPHHELDEIVQLLAEVCGAEAAGITVPRGEDSHVVVTHGIEPFVCAAGDTLCSALMDVEDVYVVQDALADPLFARRGMVDGRLGRVRFYASAPIRHPEHGIIARLCVIGSEPRTLTPLQRRMLETLAQGVTSVVEVEVMRRRRSEAETGTTRTAMALFAAELSHDMRMPLSSIVASVEMLSEELVDHPDPAVGALLARTMRAAARMTRMLELTMQVGGASTGITHVDVDLGRVVDQLLTDSSALLEQRGATVEVGGLPVVHADPDEMYSVLQNLVANAVKFARPGVPPRIGISGGRVSHGWRISVTDNGVGIPVSRREEVFSLFRRGDTLVEGHGIGLATVARLVAVHGGRAGIADAPDGGVEVWFELPAPTQT